MGEENVKGRSLSLTTTLRDSSTTPDNTEEKYDYFNLAFPSDITEGFTNPFNLILIEASRVNLPTIYRHSGCNIPDFTVRAPRRHWGWTPG